MCDLCKNVNFWSQNVMQVELQCFQLLELPTCSYKLEFQRNTKFKTNSAKKFTLKHIFSLQSELLIEMSQKFQQDL